MHKRIERREGVRRCRDAARRVSGSEEEARTENPRAVYAEKTQEEDILRRSGRPRDGPRKSWLAQALSACAREENQARETQTHAGQVAGRSITRLRASRGWLGHADRRLSYDDRSGFRLRIAIRRRRDRNVSATSRPGDGYACVRVYRDNLWRRGFPHHRIGDVPGVGWMNVVTQGRKIHLQPRARNRQSAGRHIN